MLIYFFQLLLLIHSALAMGNWPGLSSNRVLAIRSQRDVAANISIDQVTTTGVRLSKALFDREGYTNDSLSTVRTMLNVGVQSLVIDVHWNGNIGEFQLCPIDLSGNWSVSTDNTKTYYSKGGVSYTCDSIISLEGLLDVVSLFAEETDTNLSANLITLIFNIHNIIAKGNISSLSPSSNSTLSAILKSSLGNRLYTPSNLETDRNNNKTITSEEKSDDGFPTASYFLFSSQKRFVSTIWENKLSPNASYDVSDDYSVIFSKSALNSSFTSLNDTTDVTTEDEFISRASESWRFAYDDDNTKFNNESIRDLIDWGYSPILNSQILENSDISSLFNYSLWTWNNSQPLQESEAKEIDSDQDNSRNSKSAYKCAAITNQGWSVENCYSNKRVACRKNSRAFEWEVSDDKRTYFAADDVCADDYEFSVPRTALQQSALMEYISDLDANESVWIDMNSIAISDCWVTGGPYANCAYQKVSSERNFVQMLAPASSFCLAIFFSILLLRLKRVPVQGNRKHWKKLLQRSTMNEYEGVPS